jgi:hypothetical protein
LGFNIRTSGCIIIRVRQKIIDMDSSPIAGWSDFLIAAGGIAGALAGLVFVAISINLPRIIELPGVSGRAAETIILLGGTLAGTLVALIPRLSNTQLGAALSVVTLPTWGIPIVMQIQSIRRRTYYRPSHAVIRGVLHQAATLPGVLAGLALCGLLPGGIAWFAVGALTSMLVAMFNAWILLVEILR